MFLFGETSHPYIKQNTSEEEHQLGLAENIKMLWEETRKLENFSRKINESFYCENSFYDLNVRLRFESLLSNVEVGENHKSPNFLEHHWRTLT